MSCGARAEPWSCRTHHRQEPSVLNRTLDCTALGGVSCFQTHTLQAWSQSGLIHYGFFHMQEKNKGYKCPRHGSTSGSFIHSSGLLGQRKCHLKSYFCVKKRKKNYIKLQNPIEHTQDVYSGERRRHISPLERQSGDLLWCRETIILSAREPLAGWRAPGKEGLAGPAQPPRNHQLFHG